MLGGARRLRAAAVEPSGRAEDFAFRRDVRRDHAVPAPQRLGLVEMSDDRHLRQQMIDEAGRGRGHAPGDPTGAVVVRHGRERRRQVLERQERRGPERVLTQVGDGRPRVLEPLDDHPLKPLAQHRLDGALHAGRDLEQVRDGADHAVQPGAPPFCEDRADAGPVALADSVQLQERLEARPPRRQLDARVGEVHLGLGQPPRRTRLLHREALTLFLERAELRCCPVTRGGQHDALGHELSGLRPRLRQLRGQPLRAPRQLHLALAQLAGAPHEVDALRREPRLLEAQRLCVVALQGQRGALALDSGLEVRRRLPTLGDELLGVAERDVGAVALAHDRGLALADGPDLFVQAHGLLAELADLDAHLLAALEEPLELALDLRD